MSFRYFSFLEQYAPRTVCGGASHAILLLHLHFDGKVHENKPSNIYGMETDWIPLHFYSISWFSNAKVNCNIQFGALFGHIFKTFDFLGIVNSYTKQRICFCIALQIVFDF